MRKQRTRVRPARCELPLAEALEPRLLLSTVVAEAAPPPEPVEAATEQADPIMGTDEGELLEGTDGPDMILALGGDDVVKAGDGMDVVEGGDGDDLLRGGDGNDVLMGDDMMGVATGDDQLRGEEGDDLLIGGTGDDMLLGGDGNDTLIGGDGADILRGGDGDDMISWELGSADDRINGGDGFDTISAGVGADVVDVTKDDGVRDVEAVLTSAGDDQVTVDLREMLRNDAGNTFVALMGTNSLDGGDTLIIEATGKWQNADGSEVVKNGDGILLADGGEVDQYADLTTLPEGMLDIDPATLGKLDAAVVDGQGVYVLTFEAAGGSVDGELVHIVTDAEIIQVGTDQSGYLTYAVNFETWTLELQE